MEIENKSLLILQFENIILDDSSSIWTKTESNSSLNDHVNISSILISMILILSSSVSSNGVERIELLDSFGLLELI